jgi:hypothetical protein
LPRVKVRRLLVVACAALALSLACVTGQLRGVGAAGLAAPSLDSIEVVLPILEEGLAAPPAPAGRGIFVDSHFPPSRVATADVFRPPQA